MGERTSDALAGLVFVILIIGLAYVKIDILLVKPYVWMFAILFSAYVFGKYALPYKKWWAALPLGLIMLLATQSVLQTIWFYSGHVLGEISDAWTLVGSIVLAHLSSLGKQKDADIQSLTEEDSLAWNRERIVFAILLLLAGLGATTYVIVCAWQGQTTETIRTPWPLLPVGILPAIAIIWMTTVLTAVKVRSAAITSVHAGLALLSTLSLAPLVYKIGFGFDGFLHIAGEKILLASGTLHPKPFYYIGQYVFATWLNRLTDIGLVDIGHWLVPLAAAILLPLCLVFAYQRFSPKVGVAMILALFPLELFVASTPQGFSLVLGLAAVLCALGVFRKNVGLWAPITLGLWSVTIHPLSGIPLFGIALAIILAGQEKKFLRILSWPAAVLSGLAVPIAFYVASSFSRSLQIEWNLQQILKLSNWIDPLTQLIPWLSNKYVLWPAWASLMALSIPVIGIILSALAFYLYKEERRIIGLIFVAAGILIFSSGFLENVSDFAFLIQYERGDYAVRLLQIAVFLLLLGGASAMGKVIEKIRITTPLVALFAVLMLGAVGAANAHNALPRHDAAQASRGWSTGQADIEAVNWIDRSANGRDYTVLANQSVSAAAIKEFGFKRYADDVFYYPIPTGGSLYATYLRMTYEDPSIDTVKEAADLGKTDLVFVVINDYWWRAQELNEKISQIADREWSVQNGKVMIFEFDLTKY